MVILLVEDNPAEARLTEEALREAGVPHRLFLVPDGEVAMEFLQQTGKYENEPAPNFVLLDLNLPRKGGLEVLREMKADPVLCRIPVVVISNSHDRDDIDEVYRLHGNSYIVKSGDLDEFFATMVSMVDFWMRRAELPHVPDRELTHPAMA